MLVSSWDEDSQGLGIRPLCDSGGNKPKSQSHSEDVLSCTHTYELDAEPEYRGDLVEAMILEWQDLLKSKSEAEDQLSRRRFQPPRRIRLLASIEASQKRMAELENTILRYTVRLIEICFHRSSLRQNSTIDLSDIVQECQQKIIDHLLPAFDPTPSKGPDGKVGDPRKFYSLAYTSLSRHMKIIEKKVRRYHSRNVLIGHNTAAPGSCDESPVFRDKNVTPGLRSVWDSQADDRAARIVLRILDLRKLILAEYDYCGASQDVADFFFRFLIKYGELPRKKHYDYRFGRLVSREIRDAVSGYCTVETRAAFMNYYREESPCVASWD